MYYLLKMKQGSVTQSDFNMCTFSQPVFFYRQGNFVDDIRFSGPTKSRLMLKWVATHCEKAMYMLKVNDNSLVDIIRLMALVEKERKLLHVIACPLIPEHRRPIERDPRKCRNFEFCSKYTSFPGMTHFPRHCDGIGYVLSRRMVSEMYKAVHKTRGFWLEEIYVTAMLTAKINNIQYIDLYNKYTTDPNKAVKDTTVLGKRMFIFSKPNIPDYMIVWKWMLGVFDTSELNLLSQHYKDNRPELGRKTTPASKMIAATVHTANVTKKPSH